MIESKIAECNALIDEALGLCDNTLKKPKEAFKSLVDKSAEAIGLCEDPLTKPKVDFKNLDEKKAEEVKKAEAAKVEEHKIVFGNVPIKVQSNIFKILKASNGISSEYYGVVEPTLQGLINIVLQYVEIINDCKSFWQALSSSNKELAKTIHKTMSTKNDALTNFRQGFTAIYDSDHIQLLQASLKQLNGQIVKVNKVTCSEAHKLYSKLYDTMKREVETCAEYQSQIPVWIQLEDEMRIKTNMSTTAINNITGNPNSANKPEEPKEPAIQPPSPTVSLNSQSKDSSHDNNSPSRSSNSSQDNSPNRNRQDSKDSPPPSPVLPEAYTVKLSSSPQPFLVGNNSNAVQNQKMQLAAQQQAQSLRPPAFNPSYSSSPNGNK